MVQFSTQFFNLDEAKPGFLILLINLKTVKGGDNEGWESGERGMGKWKTLTPKFLSPPPPPQERKN